MIKKTIFIFLLLSLISATAFADMSFVGRVTLKGFFQSNFTGATIKVDNGASTDRGYVDAGKYPIQLSYDVDVPITVSIVASNNTKPDCTYMVTTILKNTGYYTQAMVSYNSGQYNCTVNNYFGGNDISPTFIFESKS